MKDRPKRYPHRIDLAFDIACPPCLDLYDCWASVTDVQCPVEEVSR